MTDKLKGFDEVVQILTSVNCPLITRTELWWIEEILFQPGQVRTELLKWTIVKHTDCQPYGFDSSESILNSTMMSTASNNNNNNLVVKNPETDEGIYKIISNVFLVNFSLFMST